MSNKCECGVFNGEIQSLWKALKVKQHWNYGFMDLFCLV